MYIPFEHLPLYTFCDMVHFLKQNIWNRNIIFLIGVFESISYFFSLPLFNLNSSNSNQTCGLF
jgi:hypothetical protein